jgi:hypothetical protein
MWVAAFLGMTAGGWAEEDGRRLGAPPRAPRTVAEAEAGRLGAGLAGGGGTGYLINTGSREEVRRFYNAVYMGSSPIASGWAGSLTTCAAGTTSAAFRDTLGLRINYYRAMAGVPAAVVLNGLWNAKDQQAALMMSANNNLSHTPPSSWSCYTADGAEAAGKSNLALGNYGPAAMDGYIEDYGDGNEAVGHRRWLLYPQTQTMGTGDVPPTTGHLSANATWILDGRFYDTRPAVRDAYVAWPPPGYVPYPVVFPRWSLSYDDADLSGASVSMTSNGVAIAVTTYPVEDGYGENTLVWVPAGASPAEPSVWPKPSGDTAYGVTVQNVVINGRAYRFDYTVRIMDPAVAGPDTVLPTVSGTTSPAVAQTNAYSFNAVPGVQGHQWRRCQRAALTTTEGAETGLTGWTAQTTPGYNPVVTDLRASGTSAFHLAHPAQEAQTLTWGKVLLPGAAGRLDFKSRLAWATPGQQARVQLSLDEGSSWQDVYTQNGTGEGDTSFVTRSVALAAFSGRAVLLRFRYEYLSGTYYNQTTSNVGWCFDDIFFSDVEELTASAVTDVATGSTDFTFVPSAATAYALMVRGKAYDRFFLEWGPALRVTAGNFATPILGFSKVPAVQAGQVQLEFQVANYRSGLLLRLMRAPAATGPWSVDTQGVLTTVVPNSTFRFTTPTNGSASAWFRLRAD